MNCCEEHASELRCDDCPWCRIAQLEAENAALKEDMKTISRAMDAYGVAWCRDIAKAALVEVEG